MTINASTLRPGLLVSLKTSLSGNIAYRTRDLEAEHVDDDGAQRARWETERTISDPAEHERAVKARGKARSLVTAVCAQSAFGLLCPEDRAGDLESAMREARAVADEFNDSAALTRISCHIIVGRVAADDAEAVRAINSEVRDLMAEMERGVQGMDVKAIRAAASKARDVGQMLTPDAQARVAEAIDAARKTARKIVQAGESAAIEVDRLTLKTLESARSAFLDIDEPAGEIGTPETAGRALDLAPPAEPAPVVAPARAFEME